jgi:hypothetical protein
MAVLIWSASSELAGRGAGGVTGRAREYEDGRLLGYEVRTPVFLEIMDCEAGHDDTNEFQDRYL